MVIPASLMCTILRSLGWTGNSTDSCSWDHLDTCRHCQHWLQLKNIDSECSTASTWDTSQCTIHNCYHRTCCQEKTFAIKALIWIDRVNRSDAQITYVQYEKTRLNHASKETHINFLAMDPKENGIDELFGKKNLSDVFKGSSVKYKKFGKFNKARKRTLIWTRNLAKIKRLQ